MDLFGIKRRRAEKEAKVAAEKAERARLAQEAKRKYQERKALIKDFLDDYDNKGFAKRSEYFHKEEKEAEKYNSTCPKCGSTDVVNHIKRTKGEIHGEGHSSHYSSSSSFLFGHNSYCSSARDSKIDGEIDTLPVNRCNKCGHEWKIKEAKWPDRTDVFETYDSYEPKSLVRHILEYSKLNYNPYDVKEECNSLEEMQEKFIKGCRYRFSDEYKKAPRCVIEYAIYKALDERYSYDEVPKIFGNFYGNNVDEYSYVLPDKAWEIAKKIISWEGPEENK